jgi:hypothetical protein
VAGSATTKGKRGHPTQDSIQTVRIPFLGQSDNRDSVTTKDQRFINCYFDVLEGLGGEKKYYLVKRPGMSRNTRPAPAGTTTAQGIYYWNGSVYSIFQNKIYKGSTDLGVTLTGTAKVCGFAETHPTAGTQYLCVNDGAKLYCINAAGAVTTVTVNFPSPNVGDLICLDTYFFVMSSTGTIYQSNTNDPTTWDSTKTIIAQMYNGTGIGLARQGNFLLAFSDRSMQAFYDNANTSGSVLINAEQYALQLGAVNDSIVYDESSVIWVTNTNRGGYSVKKMEGASGPRTVSTPGIERLLFAANPPVSGVLGNLIRTGGHTFYLLYLIASSVTLVYDVDQDYWVEWRGSDDSYIKLWSYAQVSGGLVGQHASDGYYYDISPTIYQDNSSNFTVLGRFRRQDLEDGRRKSVQKARLVGDIQSSTTNVSLQYSDDDYVTLSTARTLDMSKPDAFASTLGNFRKRAWQISYAGANPLRLESLELKLRLGTN